MPSENYYEMLIAEGRWPDKNGYYLYIKDSKLDKSVHIFMSIKELTE